MASRFDTIVPISELQTRSKALVEQVQRTGVPIVVTQRGRPAAMLVNYETYEGHLATLDETAFPDWERRLERARAEVQGGKLVAHDALASAPRRRKRR